MVFHFYIEMKELCEARVKPEMSSNLADEPSLAKVLPHLKLPVKGVNSLLIYVINETPFDIVNL